MPAERGRAERGRLERESRVKQREAEREHIGEPRGEDGGGGVQKG